MKPKNPSKLLQQALRRYEHVLPLGEGPGASLSERLLAANADLARGRLAVVATLLGADQVPEAAILARTLFEWAVLSVYLAADAPEEREKRARRFADFQAIVAQRAIAVVAKNPTSEELKRKATESPESQVIGLRAELAKDRNDEGHGTLVFQHLVGGGLKDLVAKLPNAKDWEFWYEHAYFELSLYVHPSPSQFHPSPSATRPWFVARDAAIFANAAIEAACSLQKRQAPDVSDLIKALTAGEGAQAKPDRLPRPTLELPDAMALAAVCKAFGVTSLALFGSAVRDNLGYASDVDLLVQLEPSAPTSLLTLAKLEQQLSGLFGRHVDIALKDHLKPALRERILGEARPLYGAV